MIQADILVVVHVTILGIVVDLVECIMIYRKSFHLNITSHIKIITMGIITRNIKIIKVIVMVIKEKVNTGRKNPHTLQEMNMTTTKS